MSWIVRNLILDRNQILSSITETKQASRFYPINYGDMDYDDIELFYADDDSMYSENVHYAQVNFEDDEYNFLLQVENKIREMYESEQLTGKEIETLCLVSEGNSYKEVGEALSIGKSSIRKIFSSTCNKIAFSLGGVFTDEGYVEYMVTKHSLTEAEISKMVTLMESNRRL